MEFLHQFSWSIFKLTMLSLSVINLSITIVTAEPTAIVNTTLGPVQGEILTTGINSIKYAAFKGIRYGKPPIGYLRFKPPIPPDPWTTIFNATTETIHCIRMEAGEFAGAEDCLFLNVFTPVTNLTKAPTKLKSVIVYIYGGAWMASSASIDVYGPDFLIEKDVLLVTFDYRGGAFGFLSLNHPNATGNAGLKDQNLVLKWVQANIRNFGGNPHNVTLMGASSGGMSVGYHIISDASAGLFHGAISMSGSRLMPWGFQTPAQALIRAQMVGSKIGANTTDKEILLNAFYDASAERIARVTFSFGEVITFAPMIENASISTDIFLSQCIFEKYFSGNFTKIPQMLGFLDQETFTFASCKNDDMATYYKLVSDSIDVYDYIGMGASQLLKSFQNLSAYLDFEHLTDVGSSIFQSTIRETTAILYSAPIDITQRIFAAFNDNNPVYYYHVSFPVDEAPRNPMNYCPIKAAGHADDISYIFYSPKVNYTFKPLNRMTRTIQRFTTLWTNFVKYGNPTPDWVSENSLNITWPTSGSKGLSLNIGDELVVESRPVSDLVKEIQTNYWVYIPKIHACPPWKNVYFKM